VIFRVIFTTELIEITFRFFVRPFPVDSRNTAIIAAVLELMQAFFSGQIEGRSQAADEIRQTTWSERDRADEGRD
jgi:hypothetical protein